MLAIKCVAAHNPRGGVRFPFLCSEFVQISKHSPATQKVRDRYDKFFLGIHVALDTCVLGVDSRFGAWNIPKFLHEGERIV